MALFPHVRMTLRTGLNLGIAAAVLLTAVLVYLPWSLTSHANVTDLNARLNAQVIQRISEKVEALLVNAVAVRQAIATNVVEGVIDMADILRLEFLFLSFLQSQPSLAAIEFAWPDNRAFLTRRDADGTVYMEEIRPEPTPATRRIDTYTLDEDGQRHLRSQDTVPSTYRPTEEFWYVTAFDPAQPTWSNIYRLSASQTFGVTTTQTIERTETFLGVLGVSIALEQLSSFLTGLDISPHGMVFLTNIYEELVAVQRGAADAGHPAAPLAELPKLQSVPQTAVQVTLAALKAHGVTLNALTGTTQFTFDDQPTQETYFVTLAPLMHMDLVVSVVIPASDILGRIERNTRMLLAALVVFIIAMVLLVAWIARETIGVPLAQVTENLRQIEDFQFERIRPIPSRFAELQQVSVATMHMSASLASFQKYIPTNLVRTLFAQGMEAELGGEQRDLTIFFMDLANFTHISEQLGTEMITFLGEYLSEMSRQVQEHEGTIDKYIGDAIMAFWGAPVPSTAHALQACRAALACQHRLATLRAMHRDARLPEIRARVGINTGSVLVGNVGSPERLNYTVIGDPVNVASRLEALNKVYGTEIIIGQETYEAVRSSVLVRRLDRVAVYGKEMGLDIFELLALQSPTAAAKPPWLRLYEQGYDALHARQWDAAIDLFQQVIALRGNDSVSRRQIAQAEAYKAMPPPPTWDGLVVMESK